MGLGCFVELRMHFFSKPSFWVVGHIRIEYRAPQVMWRLEEIPRKFLVRTYRPRNVDAVEKNVV